MKKVYYMLFAGYFLFSCEKVEIVNNPVQQIDTEAVKELKNLNVAMKGQSSNLVAAEIQNIIQDKAWQAKISTPKFLLLASVNKLGEYLQQDFYYPNPLAIPANLSKFFEQNFSTKGSPQAVEAIAADKNSPANQYRVWVHDDLNNNFKYQYFDAQGNFMRDEPYDKWLPLPSFFQDSVKNWNPAFLGVLKNLDLYAPDNYAYFANYFQNQSTNQRYYLAKVAQLKPSQAVYYIRISDDFKLQSFAKVFSYDSGFSEVKNEQIPTKTQNYLNSLFPNGWQLDYGLLKYGSLANQQLLPIEYYLELNIQNSGNTIKAKITASNTGGIKTYTLVEKMTYSQMPQVIIDDITNAISAGWQVNQGEIRHIYDPRDRNLTYYFVEVTQNNETYDFFYDTSSTNVIEKHFSYKKQ